MRLWKWRCSCVDSRGGIEAPLPSLRPLAATPAPVKSEVKPLVSVVKCPDWVRPAVQQVFGKAPTIVV